MARFGVKGGAETLKAMYDIVVRASVLGMLTPHYQYNVHITVYTEVPLEPYVFGGPLSFAIM